MWQRIRYRLLTAVVLASGLFAATAFGVGFLLAGGFLTLAAEVGAAPAALVMGAVVLAAIAVSLAVALRPRRRTRRTDASPGARADNDALSHAGVQIAQALSANPRQAALLAMGIGVLLAVSPRARDMVRQLAPATAAN